MSAPDDGLLPEQIRADVEKAVADALNQADLRSALQELSARLGSVPEDQNDVDVIVMWVWERKHADWPQMWRESDTFSPYIDGCIVASIQAQDLAAGRDPADRPLKDYQRGWLARWEGQSAHENP